jgi:hypothetical protein
MSFPTLKDVSLKAMQNKKVEKEYRTYKKRLAEDPEYLKARRHIKGESFYFH